jgi:hypothetical protein
MILSIDVGIKNLAMCLIDTDRNILNWEVDGVPPEGGDLYQLLKTHFSERPWVLEADTVLIEKQPDKNRTMKSVEDFIHAYFVIHDINTILYDAKYKIPDIVGPGKVKYRQRKNASIERCIEFLKETNQHLAFFRSHTKKDDLADTVMQALSFMNSKRSEPKKERKKAPRKPTENQRETRYSKSNLAWLFVNNKHLTDKRFERDLKRYYKNITEMLDEFELKN